MPQIKRVETIVINQDEIVDLICSQPEWGVDRTTHDISFRVVGNGIIECRAIKK